MHDFDDEPDDKMSTSEHTYRQYMRQLNKMVVAGSSGLEKILNVDLDGDGKVGEAHNLESALEKDLNVFRTFETPEQEARRKSKGQVYPVSSLVISVCTSKCRTWLRRLLLARVYCR